jgi:tetratricopeptide (TPR) repeat protein
MELIRLGAHRLAWLQDLPGGEDCAWHLARREQDGARVVLQRWPRPDDRTLDHLKELFLSRFQDATHLDPFEAHFGYDDEQVWWFQVIPGLPLAKLWPEWSSPQRQLFQRHLEELFAQDGHGRFAHPEAIGVRSGRLTLPRALGGDPHSLSALRALPPTSEEPGPGAPSPLPFEMAPILSEPSGRAIRGRSQELTYLKSLMLGLSAPAPMERVVLLQGEEGLGKEQLSAWACAVGETEGLLVHTLALGHEEGADVVLCRLLEDLLSGVEADLYAKLPNVARALAQRLQAFAFLTGGRKVVGGDPDAEEIQAALEALDFAAGQTPRLVHVQGLDRARPEVLTLLRDLVHRSTLPWLVSVATGTNSPGLKAFITQLKSEPHAAVVVLNRLEDDDMRLVLRDLLGPHHLPESFISAVVHNALGNPGLLLNLLELSQQGGQLVRDAKGWTLAPGSPGEPQAHPDLVRQVLLGRLNRLGPQPQALVRLLALADRALPLETLGRALGLAGDPLEDALQGSSSSKLVLVQGTDAQIPDPRWRELVLGSTPQPELKRLARALVGALRTGGADSGPISVSLQSLATDEASALSGVLASLEREGIASPIEVRRLVEQALTLHPTPLERARLLEHLADAWALSVAVGLTPDGPPPMFRALESLTQAQASLKEAPDDGVRKVQEARLYRKRAQLELRRRRLPEAREAIMAAADRLSSLPQHPEQPRIRLALARLHLLQGHMPKGIKALEEGLQLLQGHQGRGVDQAELTVELGRALTSQGHLNRAAGLLEGALRLAESNRGTRGLAYVQLALGTVRLASGDPLAASELFHEALQTARSLGDMSLQAQAHLHLGMLRSLQQDLAPALSHLDRAVERFARLGEEAHALISRLWRARSLAALGDRLGAEHFLLQALGGAKALLSPREEGEHAFLQADIASFAGSWKDAARLYRAAAQKGDQAGATWGMRLAQLRMVQAEARAAIVAKQPAPESTWSLLEMMKAPVEGLGSRWLDLEWHQAHGLLLCASPANDTVDLEALQAWGQALALARDLQFPAESLSASAESARILLRRGERLGARARMQDAFPALQQMWIRVPEGQDQTFLGRPDIHLLKETVEQTGLRFVLPERGDPLADWTPTQVNLPKMD